MREKDIEGIIYLISYIKKIVETYPKQKSSIVYKKGGLIFQLEEKLEKIVKKQKPYDLGIWDVTTESIKDSEVNEYLVKMFDLVDDFCQNLLLDEDIEKKYIEEFSYTITQIHVQFLKKFTH